jgi:hypothetical protein
MAIARKVTSHKDTELVLLVNTNTGQLLMERSRPNYPLVTRRIPVRHFYTEIYCDLSVGIKIREALDNTGVDVRNVKEKCLRISEDMINQLITLMHLGLDDLEGNVAEFLKSLSTKWRKEETGDIQIIKTVPVGIYCEIVIPECS